MSSDKGRRLGRGLGALIPSGAGADSADPGGELRRIALVRIRPNPYQPRREFNEGELSELQASIAASGLLQPITVRRVRDGYELISGERRLRAAGRLGWDDIPAIIKDVDDRTTLTLALIENLQRADLSVVEEAAGYRRLIDEFSFTQQQVAESVGKDRTTITNLLRILTLPAPVLAMVENGRLSGGHARALLALSSERDIVAVANETVAKQWSVREVERRARAITGGAHDGNKPDSAAKKPPKPDNTPKSAVARQVEDDLRRRLQTDVHVKLTGPERGTIEVGFYSTDDLERLLDIFLGASRDPL